MGKRIVMSVTPAGARRKSLAPGARQLAPMHLSIRVPWHDLGWDGRVCQRPHENVHCLALSRIAAEKDDARELALAGKPWDPKALPACAGERGAFMAPNRVTRRVRHPYASFSEQHQHFDETEFVHPGYSAAAVPFLWLLRQNVEGKPKENIEGLAARYGLPFDPVIEPDLGFHSAWIQHKRNQAMMLDTFFSVVEPGTSLCFFYAKRTPLADDPRRVIVAVGRVVDLGAPVDYRYKKHSSDALEGMLWERNIVHSIRPDFKDGFVFPYSELLAGAGTDATPADFAGCTAFAPAEHWGAFSYASEHVSQDAAVASLLSCSAALREIARRVAGPWERAQEWISSRLGELWSLRGAFPGFAAALRAWGVPLATLVAHEVDLYARDSKLEPFDPWAIFEAALAKPGSIPGHAVGHLGLGYRRIWESLPAERKALLKLLSRFPLSDEQATRWHDLAKRRAAGVRLTDEEILRNPYVLFEQDRVQPDGISLRAVDRGLFTDESIEHQFPVPAPSRPEDGADPRRIRAAVCDVLTRSAQEEGHTLLPVEWLAERAAGCQLELPCLLTTDHVNAVKGMFGDLVRVVPGPDSSEALQLSELADSAALIREKVLGRVGGERKRSIYPWRKLVDAVLPPVTAVPGGSEVRAREEKSAALAELYASRFSVLVGGAGTGKTTLLKALCDIEDVKQSGILLLAPTGKARVRLEQGTGRHDGKTIAQFLLGRDRYEPTTGRYHLSDSAKVASEWKTVIIDECSMLTEAQLAAVLQVLQGVTRLVLCGDPRQLPPIGEGRPFADIVAKLQPRDASGNPVDRFPMVAPGFAELTLTRRQVDATPRKGTIKASAPRDDLRLAAWFGARGSDPAADELWHLEDYDSPHLRLVRWEHGIDLHQLLDTEIRSELSRSGHSADAQGFAIALGGVLRQGDIRFSLRTDHRAGAAEYADAWQILSPLRGGDAGIERLNRMVKVTFRGEALRAAHAKVDRKVPKPMGPSAIVYGDKVISVRNGYRENAHTEWPHLERIYVANGEIGIAVGQWRRYASDLWVEFQSSPGKPIGYTRYDFEGEAPLELAYALTVHKSQGSEFTTTFVVLPYPCSLLSRELLYTALTRHEDRLVLLHQGPLVRFREFAGAHASAIAQRLTNVFAPPSIVALEVPTKKGERKRVFLEERLIHRLEDGTSVTSKGELLIGQMLLTRCKGRCRVAYENPLVFPDGRERFPDFTIWDEDGGRTFYWEHCGMLHDDAYRRRWEAKLQGYQKLGILPHEAGGGPNGTLIVTADGPASGLDAAEIGKIIDRVILLRLRTP